MDGLTHVKQLAMPARVAPIAVALTIVSDFYRVPVAEITARDPCRRVARPRQIAMWLAHRGGSQSLPSIGRDLEGRDHTTVLHGVRQIEQLRLASERFRHATDRLLARMKAL